MEQQGNLVKLQSLKQKLAGLPEDSLIGTEIQSLLTELQEILSGLDSEPDIDKDRLTNLKAFVGHRKSLDPMVRKVMLGLIGKLVADPTASTKPVTNLEDLLGKIPGLKDALGVGQPLPVPLNNEVYEPVEKSPEASTSRCDSQNRVVETALGVPALIQGDIKAEAGAETEAEAEAIAKTEAEAEAIAKTAAVVKTEAVAVAVAETAVDIEESIGFDTRELLGFFLQEASEQVDKLTEGVLELERGGARLDLVNELFRSAHTLKGASGTMGYISIVRITHLAEDMLDELRQGKRTVSLELIDLLLNVTDRVKSIIIEIQEGGNGDSNVTDLIVKLEYFLGRPTGAVRLNNSEALAEIGTPQPALSSNIAETCEVVIHFVPSVMMPAVRAIMVTKCLERLGQVLETCPSPEELRRTNGLEFTVRLTTQVDHTLISKEVLKIAEVKDVSCQIIDNRTRGRTNDLTMPVTSAVGANALVDDRVVEADGKLDYDKLSKNQTIRVPANRLDHLLNLVGEMVIVRTRLASLGDELQQAKPQAQSVGALNETTIYLGRLMNELQQSVMVMRMVPIAQVFNRFPRLVRDLNRKTGKVAELVISGEDTELDKTVIEAIGDPLMHIIRNAIDHGLEPPEERERLGKPKKGTIKLTAYHEGTHIVITVSDDGRGIDLARVKAKAIALGLIQSEQEYSAKELANLIFLPGFSTAQTITDVSGRGVGMDVVKKALVNLGGLIEITTAAGSGTTFTLRLPLTLAIIEALIVQVQHESYAIPLASVLETVLVAPSDIKYIGGRPVIQSRGNTLPLISLHHYFQLERDDAESDLVYVVVVGFGEKRLGLIVDDLNGQQEIVIKPLGKLLEGVSGFSGATIAGDGSVTLILDVGSVINDTLVAIGGRGSYGGGTTGNF